jgi:hypothetical protein
MYNIPGLAGEPSIEDIGAQTRGRIDDGHDELAVAGTAKDVVSMATGVNFLTAPSRRIELPTGR